MSRVRYEEYKRALAEIQIAKYADNAIDAIYKFATTTHAEEIKEDMDNTRTADTPKTKKEPKVMANSTSFVPPAKIDKKQYENAYTQSKFSELADFVTTTIPVDHNINTSVGDSTSMLAIETAKQLNNLNTSMPLLQGALLGGLVGGVGGTLHGYGTPPLLSFMGDQEERNRKAIIEGVLGTILGAGVGGLAGKGIGTLLIGG